MMLNLKTFINSTVTINVAKIEQAILISTLTKKPVHVEGDWFVWTKHVMTKRMLLGVILRATFGGNSTMAATKVIAHYDTVKNQLPAAYRFDTAGITSSRLLSNIAISVLDSAATSKTDELGDTTLLDNSVMQKLILEVFGQEYV